MADVPGPIAASPAQDFQPYDATSDAPVGPWVKVQSGPADSSGHVAGDWPDSAPWRQT